MGSNRELKELCYMEALEDSVVYSQKGREPIDLQGLLNFCHAILKSDKVRR